MNTLFLANSGNGAGGNIMMIVMLVVLIALFYFGMYRPQKKQQQKRAQMMDNLKKGDQVIMVDGLHAKIDAINQQDKTIVVDADGIYLTFSRMAVRRIVKGAPAQTAPVKQKTTDSNSVAPSQSVSKQEQQASQASQTNTAATSAAGNEAQKSNPEQTEK